MSMCTAAGETQDPHEKARKETIGRIAEGLKQGYIDRGEPIPSWRVLWQHATERYNKNSLHIKHSPHIDE